jgi:hypothetical protein
VRSFLDAHSIANEIRLSRTVRKTASALLVEGAKDARVFRNLVDDAVCDVVQTEGKRNATGALNVLRKSNHSGALVVVDSDFSRLDGQLILDPDVICTEDHDMEAMLLKSPAPEKVLVEHDLRSDAFGKDLSVTLAKGVMPLGYARLSSITNKLKLSFKDLDHSKFVVGPPVTIDERKLAQELLTKNPHCKHSVKELIDMAGKLSDAKHDCWQVSCGHDMTAALAVMLSKKAVHPVTAYTVERQLRLSYHPTDFAGTELCKEIEEWEQKNAPYSILRRG